VKTYLEGLGKTGEKSKGRPKAIFSGDWINSFNIGTKSNSQTFELKNKFGFFQKIVCLVIIKL
jgi:hypothetical protein